MSDKVPSKRKEPSSNTSEKTILHPTCQPRVRSKFKLCRHFKNLLKCFSLSYHLNCRKLKKQSKPKKWNILFSNIFSVDRSMRSRNPNPTSPPKHQLHWLQSKQSLLSYALSKLAFFSRLSMEKLKENETNKEELDCSHHEINEHVIKKKSGTGISLTDLNHNKIQQRIESFHKIVSPPLASQHPMTTTTSSATRMRNLRNPGPRTTEEIYRRNLKKFERLVAIVISSSSSSTSHDCADFLNAKTVHAVQTTTDENNNIIEVDENHNPVKGVNKSLSKSGSGNLLDDVTFRLPSKRIITSSKSRVQVDVGFFDWIKKNMNVESESPTAVGQTQVTSSSSSSSSSSSKETPVKDKNNNPAAKPGPKKFLVKGAGQRVNATKRVNTGKKTGTTTSGTGTTSASRRCDKCGPCAGKDKLVGAPPAYLDYGEGGAANTSGEAWKGKRKGDPVMDRLKNVDVVEEMTYLVPMPDCGGNGDGCHEEVTEIEEDNCDYYAVCESCGEMEPVPEELQRKLKQKKRKKKVDSTPVTYSRRQRFNFKNKGDMCDEDEGPPYLYEGLQCPGKECRCSCCIAGLRRNANCSCKCCQTMGTARKCSSFDEIPVGKNPQIRRILCPEEECARRRKVCTQIMPETSGMYKFDVNNQIFERQVPRTPTPIVVEVEAPQPLTKEQLLALGREIQATKRMGVGVDAHCQPQEQNPMYLPPVYGQCNPPQCQPCVPNYCCPPPPCGPGQEQKSEGQSVRSGSTYNYNYPESGYDYGSTAPTPSKDEYYSAYYNVTATATTTDAKAITKDREDIRNARLPAAQESDVNKKTSSSESLPSL